MSEETGLWRDLGAIATAHVLMLRDVSVIDDPVLAAVLTALDGVSRGEAAHGEAIVDAVARFDARVDALTPAGAVGTVSVGRGRADTAATVVRLAARRDATALAAGAVTVRRTLIELAGRHAATTMPAYIAGRPAQATTFGHYLGGVIAPFARAVARLHLALEDIDRCPLGAVALASTSLPVDRERVAALLGFGGIADNTFDAVIAVDPLVAAAQAAAAIVTPIGRLVEEFRAWLRSDATSLGLDERWTGHEPGLPQMVLPVGLDRIAALAATVLAASAACERSAASITYEPPGYRLDDVARSCGLAMRTAQTVVEHLNAVVRDGLEINRAYLANTAGRGHTTSSDLAIFLMEAEGLDPAAAANIAAMTVNRAVAEGIEASGITTQMIDASALMVIGREIAVEFEAISRYLAPRRFLERRTATGSPSPARTREYLGREERLLSSHVVWLLNVTDRIRNATTERERLVRETITDAS